MGQKNPCPMCDHWHVHKLSCKEPGCTCPGVDRWFDWVVVYLAVTGKIDQVERPLTKTEQRAASQELIKHGAGPKALCEQLRITTRAARDIIKELRDDDDEAP